MNFRIQALLIIAVTVYLSACKKNTNDGPQLNLVAANLNVVNVSNNVINFYQNGTRLNNTGAYQLGGTLGYIPVLAGPQNFQVKIASSVDQIKLTGPGDALFTMALSLDSAKLYSLFITGPTAADTIFIRDILPVTLADSAQVRYVNASADAGPLVVEGKDVNNLPIDNPAFKDVSYKKSTDFIKVKSGVCILHTYKSTSPANPKIDTLTLNSGQIYTLYSYGTTGSAGNQALRTGLLVNQ